MEWIDTHAHLDFPEFESDRPGLISKLEEQQIGVINISTSPESIAPVVELAKNHPLIWATVGIHPTDITPATLIELSTLLDSWSELIDKEPNIVGIGEVGLDYHHNRTTAAAENQKTALRQFLTFAQEKQLPVSCHCREAYGDLLTMLSDYPGVNGVIHCFSGNQDQAAAFLKLGWHLSFTAIIGYPQNDGLREVVKAAPLDKIMLETDCPFLPPADRRGSRNDPTTVIEIARLIANFKGKTADHVAQTTTMTAKKLFKLETT